MLKWFCLFWELSSLISIFYLILTVSMDLFKFILPTIHWAFCLCRWSFFHQISKVLAITSSNIFFCPLFFLSSPRTPIMYILEYLMMSTGLWGSVHFSFFSVCSSDWIISTDLPSWFFLPSHIWCWILLVNVSFKILYF